MTVHMALALAHCRLSGGCAPRWLAVLCLAALLPSVVGVAGAPADAGAETTRRITDVPSPLDLRQAIALALDNNKDIRVAVLSASESKARILSAEGDFDPNLFVEASRSRSDDPVEAVPVTHDRSKGRNVLAGVRKRFVTGTDVEISASEIFSRDRDLPGPIEPRHDTSLILTVSQDLLKNSTLGVNRTRIEVSQNTWKIALQGVRGRIIDEIYLVEQAYWDLSFAVADLDVREQQLERAHRLVQRAESQVNVGEVPPIEITRAQASAATQAVSILQASNRITRLQHRLLRLMGVATADTLEHPLTLADSPPDPVARPTLAHALDTARANRPDCLQTELETESRLKLERFARNQRLPTLSLYATWESEGLADDFDTSSEMADDRRFDSWAVGVTASVPFPNRTATGDYRAARFARLRAEAARQAVGERANREVADSLTELLTAEGRIETAQQAKQLALRLLEAEEKSFSLGRSDSLDVLGAQASMAGAERDEARATTDYATALAGLLRAQGQLLEERGIEIRMDGQPALTAPTGGD